MTFFSKVLEHESTLLLLSYGRVHLHRVLRRRPGVRALQRDLLSKSQIQGYWQKQQAAAQELPPASQKHLRRSPAW